MKVTEYNEAAAAIRQSAGALLDLPSELRAALIGYGLPQEAVATLPPTFKDETEARLKELIARAPIELGRDADFILRAVQECRDFAAQFRMAWETCVKAAKIWDDMVAAGEVRMFDRDGNPIPVQPQTAYEKAVEAQRAKLKLRLVKDDEP
jgi:hypothetical protein